MARKGKGKMDLDLEEWNDSIWKREYFRTHFSFLDWSGSVFIFAFSKMKYPIFSRFFYYFLPVYSRKKMLLGKGTTHQKHAMFWHFNDANSRHFSSSQNCLLLLIFSKSRTQNIASENMSGTWKVDNRNRQVHRHSAANRCEIGGRMASRNVLEARTYRQYCSTDSKTSLAHLFIHFYLHFRKGSSGMGKEEQAPSGDRVPFMPFRDGGHHFECGKGRRQTEKKNMREFLCFVHSGSSNKQRKMCCFQCGGFSNENSIS